MGRKRKQRIAASDVTPLCEAALVDMESGEAEITIRSLQGFINDGSARGISRTTIYKHFRPEGYENAQEAVAAAERRRLARQAGHGIRSGPKRPEVEEQLKEARRQLDEQGRMIDEIAEKLIRVTVNAHEKGLDVDALLAPLRRPDRGRGPSKQSGNYFKR